MKLVLGLLLTALSLKAGYVTVTDTIRDSSGNPIPSGNIYIMPNSQFACSNGDQIYPSIIPGAIKKGVFTVLLCSNTTASPSNTSYAVTIVPTGQSGSPLATGGTSRETWVVTTTNPSHLVDVRTSPTPIPSFLVNLSQLRPISPSGYCVTSDGTVWGAQLCSAGTGTVTHTGSLLAGCLIYGNGGADITCDSSNLFWDSTNKQEQLVTPSGFNNTNFTQVRLTANGLNPETARLNASNIPGGAAVGLGAAIAVPNTSTSIEGKAVFGAASCGSITTGCLGGQFFAYATNAGTDASHRVNLWGINTITEDGSPFLSTNFNWIYLTGIESDLNVFNTNTKVCGLCLGGNGSAQPASAIGVSLNTLGTGVVWQTGVNCSDGAVQTCISVGTTGTGNNVGSQFISLFSRDSGAVVRAATFTADPNGLLIANSLGGTKAFPNSTGTVGIITGTPSNNDCAKIGVTGSTYTLASAGAACGAGASQQTVSFSATPTFDGGNGTVKTFVMTLTGNVTSCTLQNFTSGQVVTLSLTQDATGSRTFACSGITDLGTVSGQALKSDKQTYIAATASTLDAIVPMWCTDCSPAGVIVPGSSSGVWTLNAASAAGGTAVAPNASGALGVITGSPTNNNCPKISVSGAVITLVDSGTVCGGSGVSPVTSVLWPFGWITAAFSSGTQALASANRTVFMEYVVPSPGISLSKITAYFNGSAPGNVNWAVYDSTCTLLAQATTISGSVSTLTTWVFSPAQSLSGGKYFFAYTGDSTTMQFFSADSVTQADMSNDGESSGNYHVFTGTSSTGTSTLNFPGTCGTRTAYATGNTHGFPAIALH